MRITTACGAPEIRVADVEFNKEAILTLIEKAAVQGVDVLCLPELCLTGASCGDLFFHDTLNKSAEKALAEILLRTKKSNILFALGLPVKHDGRLYNCAAVCSKGEILGLVPKSHMCNHAESRHFAFGEGVRGEIVIAGEKTSIDYNGVFEINGLWAGVFIGRGNQCAYPAGVSILLNPAADYEVIGRATKRREQLASLTSGQSSAILSAGAGEGESTTDNVFAGHSIIAANGAVLSESRFKTGLTISDLNINKLKAEKTHSRAARLVLNEKNKPSALPFVPSDPAGCADALRIAALGLKKRMEHTGLRKLVLGVSGGLDSTLAMLICAGTLDMLRFPRENLVAITMPGFGTTGRTRSNAEELSALLGASFREIPIDKSVRQHFADIGHDENNRSAVFENAQARERTQILMDIANGCGGIVVGTGDMSELALGWATYNGDHMAMYGVNAGIPKTLVRAVVAHVADTDEALTKVLRDVLGTPVSPELLPQEGGQPTEGIIGPYELHDFFLFHLIGEKRRPQEVLQMAESAFMGVYSGAEILKWEKVFIERFFSQQFKRSCMPDGVQVVGFSLSPRGGLIMPSDAVGALWLKELENA